MTVVGIRYLFFRNIGIWYKCTFSFPNVHLTFLFKEFGKKSCSPKYLQGTGVCFWKDAVSFMAPKAVFVSIFHHFETKMFTVLEGKLKISGK